MRVFFCSCLCVTGRKPSLLNLLSMRDESSEREVRIIEEVASEWDNVAIGLELKPCTIKTISTDYAGQSVKACKAMMMEWVDSEREVSWDFLMRALDYAGFKVLVKEVKYFVERYHTLVSVV